MGWETVCESSNLEDFGACSPPFNNVPAGTKVKMTASTPWYLPVAPFFDLIGAELIASYLVPTGLTNIDVCGEGLNTIVITGETSGSVQGIQGLGLGPVAILGIVVGVIAFFAAIGLTVFVLLKLEVLLPGLTDWAKWIAIGVAAVGATIVGMKLLNRQRE